MSVQRLVIGISGASGAAYGLKALELARSVGVETHLVVSRAALLTLHQELGIQKSELSHRADVVHSAADVGASIASGSFRAMGMLVAPCSVKTMSEIASGVTSTLMSRAADVVLKERRRLVLMVRETPLHLVHLRNMCTVTQAGAIVMPPVPAFYNRPQSVADIVDQMAARAIDQLGIAPAPQAPIWQPHMEKAR